MTTGTAWVEDADAPEPLVESDEESYSGSETPVRIRPSAGWRALDLRELWRYRELVYFLAWRDVKVRYKQTVLGAAWALLQPLLAMAIFTLFFGRLANLPSDGKAYPLFAYIGLLPWTYFANAASNSSRSLVANTNLISKVYFPRLAVPIANVLSGLVDLSLGMLLLVGLLAIFGEVPGPQVLVLPLLIVLAVLAAVGVGVGRSGSLVRDRGIPLDVAGNHQAHDHQDGHHRRHDAPADQQLVALVLLCLGFPDQARFFARLRRSLSLGLTYFVCGAHEFLGSVDVGDHFVAPQHFRGES